MIELTTLGGSSIRKGGAELTALSAQRQKLALVSFLAVEETTTRDRLLGIFWPEREEEKARHTLSQALYSLKKDLGQELVSFKGDQIALLPDAVDVDAKKMAAAAEEERWGEVVKLYQGPFLDRFYLPGAPGFDEWQALTRAWVGALARRGFNEVIRSRFTRRDIQGALDAALRWARMEPTEDEAQHAVVAMLALSGDRSAALTQYDAFRNSLQRELQVEPLEPTVELVEQIRRGELPADPLLHGAVVASLSGEPRAASFEASAAPAATPVDEDLDALVEKELEPRLQIVRKLSESSSATVYLAREPELKRLVAVKVFSPKLAMERRARLRFQREVQAIASLKHPNIVTLHWAGALSNSVPYFVMEYVEGRTVKDKLAGEGVLLVDEARRVLAEVAAALAAAHRRGLVHRDIQPANLLCEEETGRAKLVDFGIVQLLATSDEQPVRITESGELVGDPEWMSPEQIRGERATRRSDVYALGLLGYALLAGRGPYDAEMRTEKYTAHVRQRPRVLAELRPDVHRDLGLLLEHCLAKDPSERPTAAYVAEALAAPAANGGLEEQGLFARLIERRVPHWVAAYLAGGYGIVELIDILEGRGLFGGSVWNFTMLSFLAGVPLVFVLAWYHGRAGRQRPERLELWLLGGVALIWLVVLLNFILR